MSERRTWSRARRRGGGAARRGDGGVRTPPARAEKTFSSAHKERQGSLGRAARPGAGLSACRAPALAGDPGYPTAIGHALARFRSDRRWVQETQEERLL